MQRGKVRKLCPGIFSKVQAQNCCQIIEEIFRESGEIIGGDVSR